MPDLIMAKKLFAAARRGQFVGSENNQAAFSACLEGQKRRCGKSGGSRTLRMLNFPECDFWTTSSGVRSSP